MGLERISAILQGVTSNYAIDLMRTIILTVASLTGVDPDGPQAASHRIIADHLRASAFLVADGVDPSNEGRGYVLRRIMRRAMRHTQLLGAAEPLMWRLVPVLVQLMGQAYPELVQAQERIADILRSEETRFRTTLARGSVDPRGRDPQPAEWRAPRRQCRVQALRHLWVSARSHPGSLAEPRHLGRRRGLHGRHGPAEGGGPQGVGRLRRGRDGRGLVRDPREGRPHRVPGLRGRTGRKHGHGAAPRGARDGKALRPARPGSSCSIRRRSTASPVARSATRAR